ncbi:hypothetical protein LCGC14_2514790 [marine sediment metagenome]|uniref:Uncharacterized protein n=1 Tax=marine sediment metagenome TaxID=412755 RepID=A0A0F9AXZ1_9ZZZZ
MTIGWSYNDPYYHYPSPEGWKYKIRSICGVTIHSTGVLANLLRGIKKECLECRDLRSGQIGLGL